MLGKVRSIALAIMMVGVLGACAQAGTIVTSRFDLSNDASWDGGFVVNGGEFAVHTTSTTDVITLNTGTTENGSVYVNGGTITVDNDGTFILNNQNTRLATLVFRNGNNQVTGNVAATNYALEVQSNLNLAGRLPGLPGSVTADYFTQSGGTISGEADSVIRTTQARAALVTGGNSVFKVDGDFAGGVTFANNAVLTGTGNTIKLGSGALNFHNAILDIRTDNIKADNNVNFAGNSQILLGVTSGYLNQLELTTTTAKVTGDLASAVRLDTSFSTFFYGNGSFSNSYANEFIRGEVATPQQWVVHNVFGDFAFSSDSAGAYLNAYNETNIADASQVRQQLSYSLDERVINYGIASDVSKVAQLMNAGYTSGNFGTQAGQFNYAALEAMANGNSYFNWNGGSGMVDKGLISAMNGSNLSGVNYVAQDVARDIFTSLHSRLDAYRAVAIDIASDTALGSLGSVDDILNDRYLNRIWAGGLGSWTNAKERKGFEGYKYDGKGVMLGYDRAFGAAILGIAGAYVEGDYEDKSASSHDSKIKNYAVNAYMTYNASSGFFATLSGGWVYSDNEIRERRGGYWANEDYHTNTWHAEAKLGYDIQPCDNWSISPSVGVNFIHAKGSAHDLDLEGVAGATRSYSSAKNHLVEIPVEIQAAYQVAISDVTNVTFMANGGYAYNLNDHAVRGTSITNGIPGVEAAHIVGRKLGHSSWKAGVGVQVRHDNWDLGVKYDYYGRDKYRNHRLMGTIGYSF